MIRVFIVDDHKSVLDAFSNIIASEEDMEFVGSSSATDDVIALCKELKPDVVLSDISIEHNSSGIVLAEKIKLELGHIKVILMSGFDEISYIPGAKKAGADAFLSKSKPIHYFVDVIRAVMNGEKVFPENVKIPTANGEPPLTQRELEILRLLCQSYSRAEIADEMGIAQGTVKRHIENMLMKSGCKSTVELVVYVVGNGWISSN